MKKVIRKTKVDGLKEFEVQYMFSYISAIIVNMEYWYLFVYRYAG